MEVLFFYLLLTLWKDLERLNISTPKNVYRLRMSAFGECRPLFTPAEVEMLKNVPPVKVGEGCSYILGDNRNFLSDSRTMGTVEKKSIHAKVIYCLKGFKK